MPPKKNKSAGNAPFEEIPAAGSDARHADEATAVASVVGDPVETPSLFKAGLFDTPKPVEAAPIDPTAKVLVFDSTDLASVLNARDEIESFLPTRSIAEMNLEEELVMQFHFARALLRQATSDNDVHVPTNQKAQVMNTCAAILKTLADVQTSLYTAERVKAVEQALEKAWIGAEEEQKRAFFERYKRILKEVVGAKEQKNQGFLTEIAQLSMKTT